MDYSFSSRVSEMKSSAIREILKITDSPGVISFAGGLPAPELFPIDQIREAYSEALASGDASALQYSTTEGYLPLRGKIAEIMASRGVAAGPGEVLLTNGSQQALDLLAKLFIDPGDTVVVEAPSYLGAIQVFRSYQARFAAVPSDDGGIITEYLEKAIREHRPKLIYLTPTFSNPTGITMPMERRREVLSLLEKYNVPLIEDDPYRDLRYQGDPVLPIKSLDKTGRVIYLSTFSKTIAPGLRLGWILARPQLMTKLVLAKQGTDLHTGTLVQRAVNLYLEKNNVEGHIELIKGHYRIRRNAMLDAMARLLPPAVSWTHPQGGMFLWVKLPSHMDSTPLLKEAVAEKVAYVPGSPFFTHGEGHNYLRLNFSNSTCPQIEEGMERLSRLLSRTL